MFSLDTITTMFSGLLDNPEITGMIKSSLTQTMREAGIDSVTLSFKQEGEEWSHVLSSPDEVAAYVLMAGMAFAGISQ